MNNKLYAGNNQPEIALLLPPILNKKYMDEGPYHRELNY